ncbi:DUF7666 domain-containing protein [Leminorella grimontii]|uniref:DUF7666 domain-containing protein n=1 Tax=Leminorella grimontii TaxID=82981 RepID=UPI003220746A
MQITTYKGFTQELTCRGFQFEIGKTFEHKGQVEACSSGFHSCEYPLDCFGYYPPADSRYAETVAAGDVDREDGGDTKIASASITIKAEISMPDFVQRAIDWIWNKVDRSLEQQVMTGDYSAASNTGYRSAASNTGNRSAASNTGDYSAASNTGNRSAASNTGYRSAAEVSGLHSVACSLGIEGKARASEGSAIVVCYRDDETGELLHIRASKVGENGIKPNVWYRLDKDGQFVEIEE